MGPWLDAQGGADQGGEGKGEGAAQDAVPAGVHAGGQPGGAAVVAAEVRQAEQLPAALRRPPGPGGRSADRGDREGPPVAPRLLSSPISTGRNDLTPPGGFCS